MGTLKHTLQNLKITAKKTVRSPGWLSAPGFKAATPWLCSLGCADLGEGGVLMCHLLGSPALLG